jgi:hypothetical protein
MGNKKGERGGPNCKEAVLGAASSFTSQAARGSGDGVAAQPASEPYGRFKQTQLAFGIQPKLCDLSLARSCRRGHKSDMAL